MGSNGYFDLQVNGYAGVDFNADDLTAESLHRACEQLRQDGVRQILATIITDTPEAMCRRIGNVARLAAADLTSRELIAGIHVEGPFISATPGYVGAHPAIATCDANVAAAQRLVEAGHGMVRLLTLAPERDANAATTRWLVEQGIVVSAGHCNPSLDELRSAIDAGLSMFTHLGNGCPLQLHRHDNIIQRALSLADRLTICFIADGVHVPLAALKNYLAIASYDRAVVVTDAVAAAGMGPGVYSLAGQPVVVDEQLATWAADRSHLVGSACTMNRMVENLKTIGISRDDIRKLTEINPRRALGR